MSKKKIVIPFYQHILSQYRYKVDIKNIRTPFGECFNNSNHWVKTLVEFDNGMDNFKESSLYKFHKNFQPKNIFDTYINDRDSSRAQKLKNNQDFTLGSYPWGKWTSRKGIEEWKLSSHCGPSTDHLVEKEWNTFTSLYLKIKKQGFNYYKYGNPLGIFFICEEGNHFFIMLGGNHRAAIAAHLGIKYMYVSKLPRDYITSQVVKCKNLEDNRDKMLLKNIVSEEFFRWQD